jgi:hypothetical protein
VRISKLTTLLTIGALTVLASACSSAPAQTPPPTRAATQTPWIIYAPVTSTSEPATVTPLPTVTASQPTKSPTKIIAKATTTKAATAATSAPVAVAPTVTAAPACNLGTVGPPFFPGDGDPRNTKADGSGGSAIIFTWTPPPSLAGTGDPHVGYMIEIESHRANGNHITGTIIYISANKYLQDGKAVLGGRPVSGLANGDDAVATWRVTVVKASGDFSDTDPTARPAGLIICGSPSQTMSIRLLISGD